MNEVQVWQAMNPNMQAKIGIQQGARMMAAATATFRESTPGAIAIRTR